MKIVIIAVAAACLALSSCNTIENQYVDATGKHGNGETTMSVTMTNGKFTIYDKGETCSGAFPNWADITIVFPVNCTTEKQGSVTMSRPAATGVSILAGEGTIQFSDGTIRRFIWGPKK